jgi:phosphatidylglycerophosphate synthase
MHSPSGWLNGELSPAQRAWSAAAPALLLVILSVASAVAFAVRNSLRGDYHDKEVESRGSSFVLGMWVRRWFTWMVSPVVNLLVRMGLPPSAVTLLSVQLAVGAAAAMAAGRMALGGWLFLLAGACDFLDGRLARATQTAEPSGAALDSVVDRYAESFVYFGLAWFYRDSFALLIVLAAWSGSMLVPYVRARGEALGVKMASTGVMQRPERTVVLGVSVALSPILEALLVPLDHRPPHRLAIVGIALIAITSHITALQRLVHIRNELSTHERHPSTARKRTALFATAAAMTVELPVVIWLASRNVQVPIATLCGCALGSIVWFLTHRLLTHGDRTPATGRFAVVSVGGTVLNVGLVALLLLSDQVPAAAAWIAVRGLVSVTWNLPLREYLFASEPSA